MLQDFADLATLYKNTLLKDVLPFWATHSVDTSEGGYFSCLGRDGSVYDTDKFVWLQARQLWTFSMLLNQQEVQPENTERWVEIAQNGADFLAKHGRDPKGNWYFSLTRSGQPLTEPYNIFSDCFAAMAFSQYALMLTRTPNCTEQQKEAQDIALQAYSNVLRRQKDPKGQYNKVYPGTRPLKALAVPMILANLTLEMDWLLEADTLERVLSETAHEVMTDFLDSDRGLMYEHVAPDGTPVNCYEGRLLNPGHGIEAMWFMMAIAERQNDSALIDKATDVVINTLNTAWDTTYGGLYYFIDNQGHPPQQLEWDQKLWWVHLETLVALSMAYRLTGRAECLSWYQTVHSYTWSHFADPEHGEWYGYLNRQGNVLLPLKGGKWKGCFHVPRAMYLCWQTFEKIEKDRALNLA